MMPMEDNDSITVVFAVLIGSMHMVCCLEHNHYLTPHLLPFLQIHRNGAALRGRLAQLLTEGPSANPRWLLKFDGQPYKDEEMYERSFGKLLMSANEDDSGNISPAGSSGQRKAHGSKSQPNAGGRRSNGIKTGGGSSSEGEVVEESKAAKLETKNVEFHDESQPASDADTDTSARNGKSSCRSAREERSRRRQAKVEDEIVPGMTNELSAESRFSSDTVDPRKNKRPREDNNGEVVKVKLLTGTLYLHRGKQRRAEFIRRF